MIHYNEVWLHSAIGYVTPHTELADKEKDVFAASEQQLEAARETRRLRRQQQHATYSLHRLRGGVQFERRSGG